MRTLSEQRYSKQGPITVRALNAHGFNACYFDDCGEAVEKIFSLIPKDHLVSWGGSITLTSLGIKERLEKEGYRLLDRDTGATPEERHDIMRRALLCDTFLTGTNAVSGEGLLVNIDGNGNRVAAMTFGPRQVIVVAGMNKVVETYEDAYRRAKTIAAPLNIQRFPNLETPCSETGTCTNCLSPDSICSYIVTTRFCKPVGRIKIILIGKDLGL